MKPVSNLKTEKRMKDPIIPDLERIVGSGHVTQDENDLSVYFHDEAPPVPLVAVFPETQEQVIELVSLAHRESVPLFTLKDSCFASPPAESSGIILDFKRMNLIEGVDTRNLTAHIQRGVTWDQLAEDLKRNNVKTLMPAAAASPYVLDSMMCRVIMRSAARYPEVQISNLKVVLADGRILMTGSHALDEDGCDSKDDGGPNLSRWYIGAEDIFGIPVRASIWIYPLPLAEEFLFFGFDNLLPAIQAIRDMPRKEVCDQALVMNNRYVRLLAPGQSDVGYSWVLLLACEGDPVHVEFQSRVCRQDALALGGKELPQLKEILGDALHRPWVRPDKSHGFYTFIPRIPEFHERIASRNHESPAELFVSHGYGRAAWCEFDYLDTDPKSLEKTFEETSDLLLAQGAYFDRPLGRMAENFFAGNGAYLNQIKRVKEMMDPKRILNPDQLVKGV